MYASFSLGADLSEYFGSSTPPALNSKTEVIPLTHSQDNLMWTWGMRYTNLTAIWWKMSIDPDNPTRDSRPIAISRYDELAFTYNLTIDPETGEATLSTNYVIGKMTDLWVMWWVIILPVTVHYNATGCYRLNGIKLSDETIYDFLSAQGIEMSIVQFQSTVVLDHTAYFNSLGKNVTDNDVFVGNTTISTFAEDGERIFDADFSTKREYNLYNYTSDPSETSFETYNTTTRTCKIAGFARNPIFNVHTSLMRFIPVVMAHMDPGLYEQAKDHLLDLEYADYFYIISYPTYGGYRVEHDPTFTAYCSLTADESGNPTQPGSLGWLLVFAGLVIIAVAVVALVRRR